MKKRSILTSREPHADRRHPRSSPGVECLEVRALLSATTVLFQLPPGLAAGAARGANSTPALFDRMVGSLQAQIATLAPRDDASQHLTETVNLLVSRFETEAARLFAGSRPALNTLLQYQGEATRAAINSYKTQLDSGLIGTGAFNENAFLAIQEMTLSRKAWPVGTPLQEFLVLSREATEGLDTLVSNLSTAGPSRLTDSAADAVVHAEAYAFQTQVLLASTRSPLITRVVSHAVEDLVSRVDAAIGQDDFPAQVQAAARTFGATLVDPSGLFGARGALGRFIKQPPSVPDPLKIDDAVTFMNLQYRQVRTAAPTVVCRSFSSTANLRGRFLSSQVFATPARAVRLQALDQTWYNSNAATFVADVHIPAGYTIYVGKVAAIYQGIFARERVPSLYRGGATQVVVRWSRDPLLVYSNPRATGT